jgi:group I intron endonuclease
MKIVDKPAIYQILDNSCGKFYIGSAVRVWNRWQLHSRQLKNNIHGNSYLQRAWNKHGEVVFEFKVLEYCNKEDLLAKKQFYIDTLNPEYNLCRIAGSCQHN